jgi:transcriptional regulator with XRE-family HTH domain
MSRFGAFLKERRAVLGLSLRAFCEKNGVDASNWSKLERGRLTPPQGEVLRKYAGFLGIRKGADEWYTLFDLAAAEAGRIPEDLREEEVAAKLPVFFRTLRESHKAGGSDTEELLDELKKKIAEA